MNYVSMKVVPSKTQPGASIVLKRMNDRRRQALAELQAEATEKIRLIFEELGPLNREYSAAFERSRAVGAPERRVSIANGATEAEALALHPYGPFEFSDADFEKWSRLREQVRKIERDEMEVAAARFVVVRIEEFEIDGTPVPKVDELLVCEGLPDEFWAEISAAVKRELGLLPEEVENLFLPSTSAAAVGGVSPSGSADLAGTPATITGAAAGSSTDPASAAVRNIDSTP